MEREEEPFRVVDKRRIRGKDAGGVEATGSSQGAASAGPSQEGPSLESERVPPSLSEEEIPPQEVTFAGFLLSLSQSALIHLGEEPDPFTGERRVSLARARETIDLLSLLEEKTRGNLTSEEEGLLRSLLFTLRMKYVEKASR